MSWSNEMWTAIIIAFFVGVAVGYLILLTTNANAKKQQQLESELKNTNQQLQSQQQQLEAHFETSATLLATLAEDYKKLYSHLAQGSQTLLPETTKNLTFFQQDILASNKKDEVQENLDIAEAEIAETTSDTEDNTNDANVEIKQQPKDYTEGSSGLLKS